VISPGAREAGVDHVLDGENLLRAAVGLGLLPRLAEATLALFDDFAAEARALLNRELDALATVERPLSSFAHLPLETRERIVESALDDDRLRPLLLGARAACFLALLGAITSDVGLTAIGFPPFEDFAGRRAVSGYPRTPSGRLIDAAHEDLVALANMGQLDDYTFNRAPDPTSGDDLSAIVDGNGDLQ
jgi:hypothetical protein